MSHAFYTVKQFSKKLRNLDRWLDEVACSILRHNGVPFGQMDFTGPVPVHE